ncbi:unnamed protein product, partial [Rotaria socialis]
MLSRLENLPDEILLMILSHIRWFELIESFWSLNQRFNALIHLKFSLNKNQIVISHRDVSFNRCHMIITSSMYNLSSLFARIESIDIDGHYSNCCNIISEWIFHEKNIRFINLKRLILTQCYFTERLIE